MNKIEKRLSNELREAEAEAKKKIAESNGVAKCITINAKSQGCQCQ